MRKKKIIFLCFILYCSLIMVFPSYAGGINGNEQSIISVIHGQFEKDGIIYKVKSEYISSAESYLVQDDVDLTAEQVQSAISEIYANVQTGVESGYLTEIGKSPPPETKSSKKDTDTQSQEKPSEPVEAGDDPTVGTDSQESSEPTVPETEESTEAVEETPPETVPEVISILELVDKAPPQSYEYLSKDTDAFMEKSQVSYDGLSWLMIGLCVVLTGVTIVAFWKKLFTSRHHRKLRLILRWGVTVAVAILSAVCLTLVSLWLGAFKDSAVLNKLSDTGYYNAVYEELRKDTAISFALLDIPDEVMDNAISYERVVLAARQQVESDLNRDTFQSDTMMLTTGLKEDIRAYLEGRSVTMTEQAEKGLDLLMVRLNEKYSSLLRWPFAPWWVEFYGKFVEFARWELPAALLLLFIGQVLVIGLHHYRYRGFTQCGIGVLCGSGTVIFIFLTAFVWWRGRNLTIAPEYMRLFFESYYTGICRTGLVLGGLGLLTGTMYLLAVKAWKDEVE